MIQYINAWFGTQMLMIYRNILIIVLVSMIAAQNPLRSCQNTTSTFHSYEIRMYNFLKNNNIEFCTQATFNNLKKNTGYMKLDFYITNSKIAIEVDEAQHFPSGNSSTNIDQISRDAKLNNYFNDNGYCLIRIHWEDIYSSVPSEFLKSFEKCGKLVTFSSDRYQLFIDDIWKWNKTPAYDFMLHSSGTRSNPIKPKLISDQQTGLNIGLGIVVFILSISSIFLVYKLVNMKKLLKDFRLTSDLYNSEMEPMSPVSS